MWIARQALMSIAVIAAALYIWIANVPSAVPMLESFGILSALGIDAATLAPKAAQAGERRSGGPVQVVVAEVRDRAVADRVTAIGDGKAEHSVTVRAETEGLITEISLGPGIHIERGTVLARLQDEVESIALERARITLANAKEEADRVAQLETIGAATDVRVREAALTLRTAELALRQAQYDLDQRRVIAPISGWVGIVDVGVGDRISTQDTLVTITDRSTILIDFRVPERIIGKIAIGTPISVTPLGLRDLVIAGEVSAIDTVVERASRTLRVQGRVENNEDLLRVGMAFSVEMSFPGETFLAIDPLALQWSSEGAFVWAVRDGKATRVAVTIRQRNTDDVLIDGDLRSGEQVVVEGVQNLRAGSEVSIAQSSAATQTPLPTSTL